MVNTMEQTIQDIKQRLQFALNERNMKPIELSEKTGIPKASISHYLSGRVEPKQNRIYLMANALNVSPSWLIGYDVPMDIINIEAVAEESALFDQIKNKWGKDSVRLITSFLEMNSEGQSKLLEFADDLAALPKYQK